MRPNQAKSTFFIQIESTKLGPTDAHRVLQHGLEYWFQLARRRTDNFQHLGGRGLLLQRLGEVGSALAQFVEQARVLDGDNGLGGEILHQRNLFVGEPSNLLAVNGEGADQNIVLEHWNANRGSRAAEPRCCPMDRFSGVVGGVAHLLRPQHAIKYAARRWLTQSMSPILIHKFLRRVMRRYRTISVTLEAEERAELGLADTHRVLQHSLEHRLQLTRRSADNLEHVGGGCLLLQGLTQFVEQPRVLNGDDGLRGKILHKLDLLVGEGADFLAIDDDRTDQLIVFDHRHAEVRARTGRFGQKHGGRSAIAECLIGPQVRDVDDPLRGDKATMRARSTWAY